MALPLCRCICGSSRKDGFDQNRVLDSLGDEEASPKKKPTNSGYLSYSAAADQQLRGVPIREGTIWLLSAEEEVASITLSLYVNGFSFSHKGQEHSFSLSPFSLVRNCKFQASTSEGVDLVDFKCFKVSLFTQGACFYFGIRMVKGATPNSEDREAEDERSRWVIDMSRAIRLVTQSVFPPFSIMCEPLEAAPMTQTRLMAGYLVHHDDVTAVSVLYCELHPQCSDDGNPHSSGYGRLVVYENELCQAVVLELPIMERTMCCEKVGISCSCFSIEDHLFSTRTLAERKLWLRAISNVKVKLQNRAPSPDEEELRQYRGAIQDHIKACKSAFQTQAPMDALLERQHRRSSQVVPDSQVPLTPRAANVEASMMARETQDVASPKGGMAPPGVGADLPERTSEQRHVPQLLQPEEQPPQPPAPPMDHQQQQQQEQQLQAQAQSESTPASLQQQTLQQSPAETTLLESAVLEKGIVQEASNARDAQSAAAPGLYEVVDDRTQEEEL